MVTINLSQSLKNKRDAEFRRNQSRSDERIVIDDDGETRIEGDYLTQAVTKLNNLQGDISLAEGDNITLEVVGNEIVISSSGGGIEELPQATDTELGGIRASERTDNEVSEVKIDLATGKLYAPAPDSAVNGVPAGGKEGQVLVKIDDTSYNVEWADISGGLNTSYIGTYKMDNSGNSLNTQEAFWVRVICLGAVVVNEVAFNIARGNSDVKLIIAETDSMSGSGVKGRVVYETEYQPIKATPYIHEFKGLSAKLEKGKVYAFMIQSKTGANLSVLQEEQLVLGQGSMLPSANDVGGNTTRAGNRLNEYSNSIPWAYIKYT